MKMVQTRENASEHLLTQKPLRYLSHWEKKRSIPSVKKLLNCRGNSTTLHSHTYSRPINVMAPKQVTLKFDNGTEMT